MEGLFLDGGRIRCGVGSPAFNLATFQFVCLEGAVLLKKQIKKKEKCLIADSEICQYNKLTEHPAAKYHLELKSQFV